MSISSNHLEAVVASLLSVNNYRVEAAWESFLVYARRDSLTRRRW